MRPLPLALLIAIAAVPSASYAAPVSTHPGFKAGIVVSNFSGELRDLADLDTRSQMTFGGYVRFDLTRSFSLQPEIQYVPKGAQSHSEATDIDGNALGTITSTYTLNYLEVPLVAKIRIPTAGKLVPSFFVAPTAAFNLVRKVETEGSSIFLPSGSTTQDLGDDVAKFDFGGSIGAALDIGAGPGALTIDARFDLGLREIFTAEGAANDKNRSLLVTLGYSF